MLGFGLGWQWARPRALEGTFVIALMGQSNMVGRAPFDSGSTHPAGVLQLGRQAPNTGSLIPASIPLEHIDPASGQMGLDISFSEGWMATQPGAELVLVPGADGGTSLSSGFWRKGGAGFEDSVQRINTLLAANPDLIFAGFLWHQGESDAGNASYQAQLDQMIADLRTDVIAAGPETPFVLGQLAPDWVAGSAPREAIQDIISDTPSRVGHTAVVSSAGLGVLADGVHFDAASLRVLGSRYVTALALAGAGAGVALTGPSAPQAVGTIPDQTDVVAAGAPGPAAPEAIGTIPAQSDTVGGQSLQPPGTQGTIPDQQDEVAA